jgi:hypothetical protein
MGFGQKDTHPRPSDGSVAVESSDGSVAVESSDGSVAVESSRACLGIPPARSPGPYCAHGGCLRTWRERSNLVSQLGKLPVSVRVDVQRI